MIDVGIAVGLVMTIHAVGVEPMVKTGVNVGVLPLELILTPGTIKVVVTFRTFVFEGAPTVAQGSEFPSDGCSVEHLPFHVAFVEG